MSNRSITLTDSLYEYMNEVSLREPPLLLALREETAALTQRSMQISPEQGQFMALIARLIGARRCLEVGVFTGYSSLATALALPDDGRIVACDVSEEWTSVARRYWQQAGVTHKIELHLAPATGTLDALLMRGQAGTFDFAFIDADKENYDNYYERVVQLLRPGGLLALDNAFRDGDVVAPAQADVAARTTDALNRKIQTDQRVTPSLVPIGDGLMLARKR
jgi:predicted O-methyltransferase YrrM